MTTETELEQLRSEVEFWKNECYLMAGHQGIDTVQRFLTERDRAKHERRDLYVALEALVTRCDGAEGVRADDSNIDTRSEHALLERLGE